MSIYYDPMMAKVIATAETRELATARLIVALRELTIDGVRTNVPFVVRVLGSEAFRDGSIDTAFLDREGEAIAKTIADESAMTRESQSPVNPQSAIRNPQCQASTLGRHGAARPRGSIGSTRPSPHRTRGCRRDAGRADAGDGHQDQRQAGRRREKRRRGARARSDEDGIAGSRAGRRHHRRRVLPRRRAGPGGRHVDRVCVMDFRAARVTVVEVGPRDGLQNERVTIGTADKIEFVNRLSAADSAGHRSVGVRQPEMGAADGRCRGGLRRHHPSRRHALHRRSCRIWPASIARSRPVSPRSRCSPPPPRRSAARTSTRASTNRCRTIARSARARATAGLRVRGYLSDGVRLSVRRRRARPIASPTSPARMLDLGVFEVSVSDTIGIAHPGQVPRVLEAVLARLPADQVALHFHDTRGTALANVVTALPFGITHLRCVGRRPRRLSVRAGRGRQPRHRGSDLCAGWNGNRDRRGAAGRDRRVSVY